MKIKLIIGLGNPKGKYERTYHNAGFLFIDYLVKSPRISSFKHPLSALFKTDAHMNFSGGFVKKALKKYKVNPEELLIVHDDSDIELGKYKISFNRGAAGHKGVESIIKSLGAKNFWRLRLGIKHEPIRTARGPVRKKAIDFVLKKINKKDFEILENAFQNAANFLP